VPVSECFAQESATVAAMARTEARRR
jgi:hypothetical protein